MEENNTGQTQPQLGLKPRNIVSKAGFALFALAIVVLLVQTLIEAFVKSYRPEIADTDWYVWAVTAISMVIIGFPIYYFIMKRIPDSPKDEVVKLKPQTFIMIFFICTAAMYITSFMSSFITIAISLVKGEELINPVAEVILNGNFVLTLLYAAIVAPIIEEVIFRKLLLDKLRRFGDIPAILMTGIAFGLFHLNLSQIFYATVLGFIFAYVVVRTNTIKYSIILHMMINLLSTLFAPLVANESIIGIIMIYIWVVVAIVLGIVFFVINLKEIRLDKAAPVMKPSAFFLNTGTILYTVVCLVIIVIVTIS